MKNVTDLFKESCNADIVSCMVKIEVSYNTSYEPIVTLSGDDLIENSIRISSQTTSYQSFTIGGVCSSRLNLTLSRKGVSKLKESNAFRKGMCWKVIQWNKVNDDNQDSTNFSVNIDGSENTSGKCKLGVFYVSSIDNDDYSCDIEAYDGMLAFEKSINATKLKFMRNNLKTPGEWVEYIVTTCRTLGYAFSYNMASNLVNLTLKVKISDDVSVKTFREALGYLTILVGGFATFDEDGNLFIRTYDYIPVELTMSHKRLLSGKFDNEVSEITGFYSSVAGFDYENSVTNASTSNTVDIYVAENPFLRGIQEYNKTEANPDILNALTNISDSLLTKLFYGCDITVTAMPYIDLGDCLSVSRLVVSESGVSSDVINSNIVVCDMTYNFGSSLSIKSRSTSGTSTSSTTGDIGSNPKESDGKDGRVDELINAFTGVRYEYRTVMIPLTYDKPLFDDLSVFKFTNKLYASVSFTELTTDNNTKIEYKRSQQVRIRPAENGSPRGEIIGQGIYDTEDGEGVLSAYNMTCQSDSILGFITDPIDSIDEIKLSLSFNEARKSTGFSCNDIQAPFECFSADTKYNLMEDYKEDTDIPGDLWYRGLFKATENSIDGFWLSPPRSNASATLNYNFLDGGFNQYSLDEDRALFSCNLSGSWSSENINPNGSRGEGGAYVSFSTPKIKTSVYIKDGSNSYVNTGSEGIYKDYTLDEFKNAFGNNESLQVKFESSFEKAWHYGWGIISGHKNGSYGSVSGDDVIGSNSFLRSAIETIALQSQIGTYGNFIQDAHGSENMSYIVAYNNLPEHATLRYRAKVEVKEDINAVIDAINQGVSANEGVSSVNEAVILLGDRVTELSDSVTALNSEVATMKGDITSLMNCCNDVKSSIETLNTDYTNLNTSVNNLNSAVSGLSGSVDSITSRLDAIDLAIAVIPDIQSTLVSLDARVTALEQGGGPTVDYKITKLWFEDTAGFRFDNYVDAEGRYRIPTGVSFYICIAVSQENSTNSFFYIDTNNSRVQIGSDTTNTKSEAAVSSDSVVGYLAKAVWSSLGKEVTSDTKNVLGFAKFSMDPSETHANQDVNLVTITNNPTNGYPSIGIGEYLYKFVLSSSAGSGGEIKVLQDWSSNSSISFTIGSDEVNNMTDLWIRWYVTDGYITELFSQEFVEKVAKTITDIWFEDANGFKFSNANAADSNGDIRIVTSTPFYICISTSDAGSLNSFYKVSSTAAEGKIAIGEETNTNKSTETVTPSSSGVEYFAEAYWSDDNFRAVSEKRKVVSVAKLKAPSSSTVVNKSGSNCSFKIVASNGYPSVGIGNYEYKFVLSSSSVQSGEIKVLQDWSASDTCEFVLGSDEVNNLTSLFIRYYVRDIYTESYYGYKKFTL